MANPTRYKGSGAFFSIGLAVDAQVNLTGIARGLDSISFSEVEDQRDVPGGGVTATKQALGYREGTSSISVDENEFTRPLFWSKNGKRFYVTYGPEGNGSGLPKYTYEAIGTITHTFEERGVRRFSIELAHDGLAVLSTF